MKSRPGCIPCIMKQAYNTAIRATGDQHRIIEILNAAADHVKTIDMDCTPADNSNFVYEATERLTGVADPYGAEKKRYNDICLDMVPSLRRRIEYSIEPLHDAIKTALLGNIIDLGIGMTFDLDHEVEEVFRNPLAVDDYVAFRELLESGRKRILYLGDNAGEIVFDKLLIEELYHDHDVTYVVKSGPIINDATMDDADYVGMTGIVTVIETGSNGIGVKWSEASDAFKEQFASADLIISKGQGNFETVNDCAGTIFFLLKAKCDFVAEELGVKLGEVVFKKGGRPKSL